MALDDLRTSMLRHHAVCAAESLISPRSRALGAERHARRPRRAATIIDNAQYRMPLCRPLSASLHGSFHGGIAEFAHRHLSSRSGHSDDSKIGVNRVASGTIKIASSCGSPGLDEGSATRLSRVEANGTTVTAMALRRLGDGQGSRFPARGASEQRRLHGTMSAQKYCPDATDSDGGAPQRRLDHAGIVEAVVESGRTAGAAHVLDRRFKDNEGSCNQSVFACAGTPLIWADRTRQSPCAVLRRLVTVSQARSWVGEDACCFPL